jgi:hypothetical protein
MWIFHSVDMELVKVCVLRVIDDGTACYGNVYGRHLSMRLRLEKAGQRIPLSCCDFMAAARANWTTGSGTRPRCSCTLVPIRVGGVREVVPGNRCLAAVPPLQRLQINSPKIARQLQTEPTADCLRFPRNSHSRSHSTVGEPGHPFNCNDTSSRLSLDGSSSPNSTIAYRAILQEPRAVIARLHCSRTALRHSATKRPGIERQRSV